MALPRASLHRLAPLLLAAALLLSHARTGAAAPLEIAPIKRTQMRLLAAEPMHERAELLERARELRRLAKRLKASGESTLRARLEARRELARGERAREFAGDEESVQRAAGIAKPRRAVPMSIAALPNPNVRCNDPTGDQPTDGQCEVSIARWNNYMVAAWNDGRGFSDLTGDTQGWGISVDGGATWSDEGVFPIPSAFPTWVWSSDPVVTVNPNTGAFYYSGLADASSSLSAIGVTKGRFHGSGFAWDTVSVVRTVSAGQDYLDKEWIALDPATGRVFASYTRFPNGVSEIDAQYADSSLAGWSPPAQLSPGTEAGRVQGSRPIVGPDGTAYVQYYLIGTIDADYYRICRSADGGNTWSAPNDVVSFYSNYGSGAPGFNRPIGIEFASIAVDRTGGAHNGRLYLSWAESLDWYDDEPYIGLTGAANEIEPNDSGAQATPVSVGQTIRGTLATGADRDYYALHLNAGQSVIVEVDSLATGFENVQYGDARAFSLRMFAVDGLTTLCWTTAGANDLLPGYAAPGWIFTAPATATYFIRAATGSGSGPYRIRTGAANNTGERGRDQRDVFVAHSDDGGVTWSTPVRASNSPIGYDDWLPEVAVSGDGDAWCEWYDWRDADPATSGGQSSTYLARSADGGATWTVMGPTSDAISDWTNVASNIAPNEGDYLSLFADGAGAVTAWSDGRAGNPDIYMESWAPGERSGEPILVSVTTQTSQVSLAWFVDAPAGFGVSVERRLGSSGAWAAVASLASDGAGQITYVDSNVALGDTYEYRLGVMESGVEHYYGLASATISNSLVLDLAGSWPNPLVTNGVIAFSLPASGPATLEVIDLTGRRVSSRDVGALGVGAHQVPVTTGDRIRPGLYVVRLTQGGQTRSRRMVVLKSLP
ncbi:MAG TPA: T9SS type A sorting domain-containing protein [Candidatus Acidoferrales bacterium]|nr:T9SS type A sorting domain-containing protein [Candidatus Acidoferrales bacterium]